MDFESARDFCLREFQLSLFAMRPLSASNLDSCKYCNFTVEKTPNTSYKCFSCRFLCPLQGKYCIETFDLKKTTPKAKTTIHHTMQQSDVIKSHKTPKKYVTHSYVAESQKKKKKLFCYYFRFLQISHVNAHENAKCSL